ncbi:MAG TPA: hypothetical protein VE957_22345, partial [Terriglobales bacterium]|nr:hypothetical protein [Terriglobales bacterium]
MKTTQKVLVAYDGWQSQPALKVSNFNFNIVRFFMRMQLRLADCHNGANPRAKDRGTETLNTYFVCDSDHR